MFSWQGTWAGPSRMAALSHLVAGWLAVARIPEGDRPASLPSGRLMSSGLSRVRAESEDVQVSEA